MASAFTIDFQNEIINLKFARPYAGNSFGIDEAKDLNNILSKYKKTARGLMFLSMHPNLFCGGGDLKAHGKLKTKKAGLDQAKAIRKSLDQLAKWPIPKVAIVSGDCFGGGMELLSCFDHRIASPHVLFGFWQRRIGLSFGWGGFGRWSKKISADVIKDLSFTARVFGSHEALRLGVIHEIGNLDAALRWLRGAMRWPVDPKFLSELDAVSETRLFEQLWWSDDHRAVLKKF